jgi:transcriptional regulator GlxA family with amidase domain
MNTCRILSVTLLSLLLSCTSNEETVQDLSQELENHPGLNVAFLIVDGVYNSELIAPMDIFHHTVFHTEPGMKVFTVDPRKKTITTFEGLRILPDFGFEEGEIPRIDILVVPSAENSMGSDLENESLISFVRDTGSSAQYVMSLCDGAFVLAQAGLVEGKESTTFPGDIKPYRERFPQFTVHENVSFVRDGNLITSAGGAKSYDPALYLTELLYGKQAADGVAAGLVINWNLDSVPHIMVTQ